MVEDLKQYEQRCYHHTTGELFWQYPGSNCIEIPRILVIIACRLSGLNKRALFQARSHIADHGLLEAGTTLLRKPFSLKEPIHEVRLVLDR